MLRFGASGYRGSLSHALESQVVFAVECMFIQQLHVAEGASDSHGVGHGRPASMTQQGHAQGVKRYRAGAGRDGVRGEKSRCGDGHRHWLHEARYALEVAMCMDQRCWNLFLPLQAPIQQAIQTCKGQHAASSFETPSETPAALLSLSTVSKTRQQLLRQACELRPVAGITVSPTCRVWGQPAAVLRVPNSCCNTPHGRRSAQLRARCRLLHWA